MTELISLFERAIDRHEILEEHNIKVQNGKFDAWIEDRVKTQEEINLLLSKICGKYE